MNRERSRLLLELAVPALVSGLLLANAAVDQLWPASRLVNEPLHATVEAVGGLIAFLTATLLLWRRREARGGTFSLVALGLVSMGVLDVFHAATTPGRGFVLLHSAASLAGAICFALLWSARLTTADERRWRRWAPAVAGGGALMLAAWTLLARQTLPAMTADGVFTTTAVAINVLAGTLFALGAVRLLLDFHRSGEPEIYLLACMAVLFGLAGLTFPFSALWNSSWWMWHLWRLLAYALALGFIARHHRRTVSELDQRVRHLSVIYAIDNAVASSLDLDEILKRSLAAIAEALDADVLGVLLLDADGQALTLRASRGASDEFVNAVRHFPLGEGVAGRAAAERRPVVLDVAAYPSGQFAPVMIREGLQTLASTPLLSGQQLVGALSLGFRRPHAFTEGELTVLMSIGQQLGTVAHRARLREGLDREFTERMRSEAKYRTILHTSLDGLLITDDRGRIIEVNEAYCGLIGYGRDELVRMTVADIEAEERQDEIARHVERIKAGGSDRFNTRHRCKDGRLVDVEVSVTPLATDEGTHFVAFLHDITSRKRAQESLRESEARFRAVVESASDGIISTDGAGNIVFCNAAAEKIFGCAANDLVGKPVELLVPARYRNNHRRGIDRLAASGTTRLLGTTTTLAGLKHTGEEFPLDLSLAAWSTGSEKSYTAIVRDLTERQRTERERAEAESRYENLVDQSLAGFAIMQDERVVHVNPKMADILGYSASELLGLPSFFALIPQSDRPGAAEHLSDLIEGRTRVTALTVHATRKDGKLLELDAHATRGEYRGRPAIMAFVLDVTERRQLEAQFLQAQKMEAVGRLTGGVAHDFNNILTAILGYAELVLNSLEPDSPLRTDVAEIKRAGTRAAGLTKQLLAFSRRQVVQPRVLNLNETVGGLEGMLRRLIGEDIQLATVCVDNLRPVKADPGQIEQVLMNLAVNARDAMPGGGTLTIETAHVDLDDVFARTHPGSRPGPHVRLSVRDTGCGMPPEVLAHVFEPFFTTKGDRGTGLGLATVYGIVKQSGGYISISSEPGRGTTVDMYLPEVEASQSLGENVVAAATPRGSETILLVEDENLVRDVVRRALERHGYKVLPARDGSDALLVAQRHQGRIDLVISDVVMPNMSGPELVERMAALQGCARVIFLSGYSDQLATSLTSACDWVFVQKPIEPEALALRVRQVLDGPPRG